jgi:hypothetical protein
MPTANGLVPVPLTSHDAAMTASLSPLVEAVIAKIFTVEDQGVVSNLIEEQCGNNLPFMKSDNGGVERIRLAVLKLAKGNANELLTCISLAQLDWRDVLINADFANDTKAHLHWAKEILR